MSSILELKPPQMDHHPMERRCEDDLAALLQELTGVQEQLLDVLGKKRQSMAAGDLDAMVKLQPVEKELSDRLQRCHDQRTRLLQSAANQGLACENLQDLAVALDQQHAGDLRGDVQQAAARMRLLRHHSLANWVLAQKSLLHVSQMLEIIATGGRLQPTYGKDGAHASSGALVDQEA